MTHDRIGALEVSLTELRKTLEERSETRDQQLGSIAADVATQGALLEGLKPAGLISIWGPAAASVALIASLGGTFLTMLQREQAARLEVTQAQLDSILKQQAALDTRLNAQLIELGKYGDRQFGLATANAYDRGKLDGMDKRLDDVDRLGSRKWLTK